MALESVSKKVTILSTNENGDHLEKSNLLSSERSVIVLANGVKIHSTLNPNAKEFYPSYMKKKFPDNVNSEVTERTRTLGLTKMANDTPAPSVNTATVENALRELQDEDCLKAVTVERPKSVLKIIEIIESVNDKKNIKNAECMSSLLQPPVNILEKMPVIAKDPKELFFGHPILKSNNSATSTNISDNYPTKTLLERQDHSADLQKPLDKEKYNTEEFNSNSDKEFNSNLDNELFTTPIEVEGNVEDVGDHKCKGDVDEEYQINQLSKSQTALKPTITKEILDGLAPPTTPTNECCIRPNEKIIKNVTFEEDPPKAFKNAKPSSKIMKTASPVTTTKNNTLANPKKPVTERFTADKRKEGTTDIQNQNKIQKGRPGLIEANKTKPLTNVKSSTLNTINKTTTRTATTTTVIKPKAVNESQKVLCTSKTVTSSSTSKVSPALSKEKDNLLQTRKSSTTYTGSSKSSSVPSVSNSKSSSTFNSKLSGNTTSSKSKEAIVKATRSTLVTSTRKKDT